MNIFAVSVNPKTAANNLCDKHIPKMIVETAQMLSTAHRLLDGAEYQGSSATGRAVKRWRLDYQRDSLVYHAGYVNHPCTTWCRSTLGNYQWLATHGRQLCEEFKYRYMKPHKTESLMDFLLNNPPVKITQSTAVEDFTLAMPDTYKFSVGVDGEPLSKVEKYRNFYICEKSRFAYWKNFNNVPMWYVVGCVSLGINFKNDCQELKQFLLNSHDKRDLLNMHGLMDWVKSP
jgi:hypothetical protein